MGMSITDGLAAVQSAVMGNTQDLGKILTALLNGDFPAASKVAIGAGTTVLTSAAHANRPLILNSASAIAITLPPATGSGDTYSFTVGVAVLTGGAVISKNGTDVMKGLVISLDNDAAAVTGYAALAAGDDVFTMNATTTGGLLGDWVTFTDIAVGIWAVSGAVVVPAGSNPADPFS